MQFGNIKSAKFYSQKLEIYSGIIRKLIRHEVLVIANVTHVRASHLERKYPPGFFLVFIAGTHFEFKPSSLQTSPLKIFEREHRFGGHVFRIL